MVAQTVFFRLPAPFSTLQALATPSTPLLDLLPPQLASQDIYLRTSFAILPCDTRLEDIAAATEGHAVCIDVCARFRGGKGGFGTNLRAAGGRMSMNKAQNTDSCRDLSGRRISTLKEAQRQADLIESVDTLKAQAAAESKAKLAALERTLGVSSSSDAESSAAGAKRIADIDVEEIARKKYKFEDNQYLEESREIKDNVRSAVSAAMLLKKKKKAKADALPTADNTTTGSKAGESTAAQLGATAAKKAEKDKAAMPPPPTVASVTAGTA